MRQLARAFLLTVASAGDRLPRPPLLLFLPAIIFFVSLSHHVTASNFGSVSGVVIDSVLAEPVGGILVTILPDGYSVVSDANGRFHLDRLTPGFKTLQISSRFYHSRAPESFLVRVGEIIEISVDVTSIVTLESPQTVTADPEDSPGRNVFRRKELAGSNSNSVGEFLRSQGMYLQGDGRAQYVSLRGYLPDAVLVLVDGTALNPDGTAVDLSAIPLKSIERIEVYNSGAAARFGADALGGAVNLVSRKARNNEPLVEAVGRSGSFGLWGGGVVLAPQTEIVDAVFQYDYEEAENNYSYQHPYLGEQKRHNNASRRYSLYGNIRPQTLPELNLSLRLANEHYGIPGAIFQETGAGAASLHESRLLSVGYQSNNWLVRGNYHELYQEYRDPSAFIPYDNHYTQIGRQLEAQWSRTLNHWLGLEAGAQFLAETFLNRDPVNPQQTLPTVSRRTESVRIGAELKKELKGFSGQLSQRYRWDRVDDGSHLSPYIGASLKYGSRLILGANTAYSESYRTPPIDALFWQNDVFAVGNPDLKPETAIKREAGISLEVNSPVKINAKNSWYESDLADLIIWRRQFDGKYKPVNLDRAHYSGVEWSIGVSVLEDNLRLKYTYSTLSAVNRSAGSGYEGNQIPFRPDRTEMVSATCRLHPLTISYRISHTGRQYIREANTKALEPYTLHDLGIQFDLRLFEHTHKVDFEVLNLFNEHYELLERMPMPPRSFRVELQASL